MKVPELPPLDDGCCNRQYSFVVGESVGDPVGAAVGFDEGDATATPTLGAPVGDNVGTPEGDNVTGDCVTVACGAFVGTVVGENDGTTVGPAEGADEGELLGDAVGAPVGVLVGAVEGDAVGAPVGVSLMTTRVVANPSALLNSERLDLLDKGEMIKNSVVRHGPCVCAKLRTTDSVPVFGKEDTVSAPFTVGAVPASGQRGLMQKGICDQGKMNEQSLGLSDSHR
jgi:hypothetical protein